MATYKGILTNNGKALIAGATVSNKINYSHIAVGDGNGSVPVPSETRTALINEKARIALNVVEINPNNTNQIVCEAIIPSNVGGFYIRELGLYAGNTMVVNSSYPPTYKPLADEGGAREINIKLVINIQNAEVIALYLDDSLIYATREWVNKNYIRRNEIVDNLTTDDPTKPLSAKQGKYLQDNKLDKTANAVGLKMGEDRTLLPTELSPLSLQAYFGTLDSNNNSTFFCDYLTLNGWVDSSGGMKNALVFSKTGQSLHHYQADYSSDTWTIKKQIAYTDSNISGNAASATKLQNGRKINDVVFDGTKDIYLEAPVRFNGTISTLQQLDQALLDGKYTVVEFNVAGLYGYGVLVVFRSGGMCHQVYYPHQAAGTNNATMAMRQAWNVNGNIASWSDWRIVGTRDDSKLPLVGGTVSGNLRVNGIVFSNKVYGDSDLWFTSEDEQKARRILTGGILASDSYSEANLIPNLGIYAKGAIHTKTGVYADKYYGYNGIATYVGNLDGRLTTPRLINGVEFDASTDINIPPVSFYIPAGADLNNYKRTGFYYQNADVDAAKITNVPQGNAFALRVEESAGCSQWLTPYNGGGVVYYRHFYDGTWSTWIKMDPHNIDGNAATATKLKNPRKIFGQDFDGSSDVAGNITTS
ncbi:phage tail-collar fiber domain-containing protein, partial [Acinetobacter baumannii]